MFNPYEFRGEASELKRTLRCKSKIVLIYPESEETSANILKYTIFKTRKLDLIKGIEQNFMYFQENSTKSP